MTAFSAASIASSVAGTTSAEQVAKREQQRVERARPKGRSQADDEVELHQIERAEATRAIHNNTDQDAAEDHQEHPAYYTPDGLVRGQGKARSIDLSG